MKYIKALNMLINGECDNIISLVEPKLCIYFDRNKLLTKDYRFDNSEISDNYFEDYLVEGPWICHKKYDEAKIIKSNMLLNDAFEYLYYYDIGMTKLLCLGKEPRIIFGFNGFGNVVRFKKIRKNRYILMPPKEIMDTENSINFEDIKSDEWYIIQIGEVIGEDIMGRIGR